LPRKLPEQKPRIESGAVQFGNDWPGLFIRGDSSYYLAQSINTMLESTILLLAGKIGAPGFYTRTALARAHLESLKETIIEEVVQ